MLIRLLGLLIATGLLRPCGSFATSCDTVRIDLVNNAKARKRRIVKPPGPYQSVLNAHLEEIAALRETRPQPTPYRTIARILKEKHNLEVSPNSIWSFVRARTLGRRRKLKYKIAPDLIRKDPAPPPRPVTTPVDARERPIAVAAPEELNPYEHLEEEKIHIPIIHPKSRKHD